MSLYSYAQAVLANVETVWAAATITLPDLRYVAEGPFLSVAFDCEQVVVSIDQLQRGRPGEPQYTYDREPREWSATVTVSICRLCMATSQDEEPPTAAEHHAAAQVTLADVDLLWRKTSAIFDIDGCQHHGTLWVQPLEVQGALGGARLTAHVDLLTV